jgi:hypothetical protein
LRRLSLLGGEERLHAREECDKVLERRVVKACRRAQEGKAESDVLRVFLHAAERDLERRPSVRRRGVEELADGTTQCSRELVHGGEPWLPAAILELGEVRRWSPEDVAQLPERQAATPPQVPETMSENEWIKRSFCRCDTKLLQIFAKIARTSKKSVDNVGRCVEYGTVKVLPPTPSLSDRGHGFRSGRVPSHSI